MLAVRLLRRYRGSLDAAWQIDWLRSLANGSLVHRRLRPSKRSSESPMAAIGLTCRSAIAGGNACQVPVEEIGKAKTLLSLNALGGFERRRGAAWRLRPGLRPYRQRGRNGAGHDLWRQCTERNIDFKEIVNLHVWHGGDSPFRHKHEPA